MENTPSAAARSILIQTGTATRDISRLVALTRLTEMGLHKLQERTGSTKNFSHSAFVPDRQNGVSTFKLGNPKPEDIFEALKAAGRQLIFLRETGEIAPAFPQNGIPAAGQPHLIAVRDWAHDDETPAEQRGFKSAATVMLADGGKTDIYFAAPRSAFVPPDSVVLHDGLASGPRS